jgi:hypothetical protein
MQYIDDQANRRQRHHQRNRQSQQQRNRHLVSLQDFPAHQRDQQHAQREDDALHTAQRDALDVTGIQLRGGFQQKTAQRPVHEQRARHSQRQRQHQQLPTQRPVVQVAEPVRYIVQIVCKQGRIIALCTCIRHE